MYEAQGEVDLNRQKNDLMYHLIVNTEATTLDEICDKISNSIIIKYPEASIRLQQMLQNVQHNNDRIGKHALLLFALYQEPDTFKIFVNNKTPRVPPEKFKLFTENELPVLVNKLMKGAFTSLRAFVEDARWTYVTL